MTMEGGGGGHARYMEREKRESKKQSVHTLSLLMLQEARLLSKDWAEDALSLEITCPDHSCLCNSRKACEHIGSLWGRKVASNENDSPCPFNITLPSSIYFPKVQDGDTISIPLKKIP